MGRRPSALCRLPAVWHPGAADDRNGPPAMKPYLTHEHPIRLAHRGSAILWPQNTMVAFQGALDLGCRYLEIDVHVSRDGQVVVFHDDHLDRLTDGTGNVWDHDWDDLRSLDAAYRFGRAEGYPLRGTGIRIPLLEELLTTYPDALLNVDLKQDGIAEAVASLIRRLDAFARVLIGSFHDDRIERFRSETGGAVATSAGKRETRSAVIAAWLGRPVDAVADAFQVPEMHSMVRVPTRRFVEAAHAAGKHVHVWTVNEPSRMRRLLDAGVDGIITDRPDLLDEVLADRRTR
jgi:glycerophosphoryl diester phosphodiesterase